MMWFIIAVALIAFVVMRLSALAGRLDRLHHRIDLARASLDAQLVRRARAVEALATSELLDPAASIVLAQAASRSRHVDPDDLVERGLLESELSRDLRDVLADPETVAGLVAAHEGQEIMADLGAAATQVALTRRFLNDGVQAARLLRSGPLVRWFRLAGSAPQPETFEMDDELPVALLPYGS